MLEFKYYNFRYKDSMTIFPETNLTYLAHKSRYRHHWTVDLMIALLLFIISISAQGMITFSILLIRFSIRIFSGQAVGDDLHMLAADIESSSQIPLLSLFTTVTLILIPILYCTILERRPLESLGFSSAGGFREYTVGFLLGLVMLSVALGICILFGYASIKWSGSDPVPVLAFFFGYLIQGMSEEVFCRGFLLQTLSIRNPPWFAVLISSLFFASLHLLNKGISFLSFANLFLFGVFASTYMWRRGSIWGIAALHSAWNFAQGNLFGISVSGLSSGSSIFQAALMDSKHLWNGGNFGLEGGLAVTIVLFVFTVLLFMIPPSKGSCSLPWKSRLE